MGGGLMNNRTKRRRLRVVPGTVQPTPERLRQIGDDYDDLTEATSGGITRRTGAVRAWTPLENLYRNRLISGPQYDAGEKYYRDWYIGFQASAQVTMKLSDFVSGGGGDSSTMDAAERRVFHQRRFAEANKLLDLFGMRKPVHWLIVDGIKPQDVGRRFRGYRGKEKAAASGTTLIATALNGLAKFYGLIK